MFICKKLKVFDTMFGRLSEVLQNAADVLAPPPTALQDFEYHWKLVKNFYTTNEILPKVHINDTNIPFHLEQMLQILIRDCEEGEAKCISECLEFLFTNRPLDLLVELAITDSPPGARICVLNWIRRMMSCIENPPISHASIFQPIQKLLPLCNGKNVSPYEHEEILFLTTVAALVRRDPIFINLFLPSHQHSAQMNAALQGVQITKIPKRNPLFDCSKMAESSIRRISILADNHACQQETEKCIAPYDADDQVIDKKCDIICKQNGEASTSSKTESVASVEKVNICDCEADEKLILLDAILSYLESPDHTVVVRACEGAIILSSLSTLDITCNAVQNSLEAFGCLLIDKLFELCQQIPDDMDLGDIDEANISWGLTPRDSEAPHYVGKAQLCEFLCWLDYCDCICKECDNMQPYLGEKFRTILLENLIEPALLDINASVMIVLVGKIIKQIHSYTLSNELATWLIAEEHISNITGGDCLLTILIENTQENSDITLPTLQLIEALLDNPNERVLHAMIFCYLNRRGYCDVNSQTVQTWSDEEYEREKRRGSADVIVRSRTLAPNNILKIINHFLLLLPRQIMSESIGTCYEEYVQDASRHYKIWIKKTEQFDWPLEAVWPDSEAVSPSLPSLCLQKPIHSALKRESQCNDSGISEESFYEGPLLRVLFSHVRNMALQPYELNLAVIAIISKLALLPHPYLHEILLNPEITIAQGATTLWSMLQALARQLLSEIPRIEGFQQKIANTGKRLLTNPPILNDNDEDSDPLFESIVVLEEFCKELAAIAFVKYHHATE